MAESIDDSILSFIWTDHKESLQRVMAFLRNKEQFADVTLVCGKRQFPVHKVVLAMCSSYFEELLESSPCKHPIIVLVGIPVKVLEYLLDFMYLGETDVSDKDLDLLLHAAQELKITGLISNFVENQERQTTLTSIKQEPGLPHTSINQTPITNEGIFPNENEIGVVFQNVISSGDDPTIKYGKGLGATCNNNGKKRSNSADYPTFRCNQCESCFETVADLNHHKVSHIEDKFFSCFDCPYKTLNYNDYNMHISKHIKLRPFACPYCQDRQVNQELHISHQQRQHPTKEVVITETKSLFEIIQIEQEPKSNPAIPYQEPPPKLMRTTITLPANPPSWNLPSDDVPTQRKSRARTQPKTRGGVKSSRGRGTRGKTTSFASR